MIRTGPGSPLKGLRSLSVALFVGLMAGCGGNVPDPVEKPISSRSYKGHENDSDANNLVRAYPAIAGTRLDDCRTCHAGKLQDGEPAGSACDRCHDLLLHGTGGSARETLNAFGIDYLDAGRSAGALRGIGQVDSDGDGFSNDEELRVLRFPGSERSRPGQAVAPVLSITLDELKAIPPHSQFVLANTSRQQFDDYVTYTGVTVGELLEAQGIGLDGATGITVIALDGYKKSLPIEYVDRSFPRPLFYARLDAETLGPDCGLVRYPANLPDGLSDGSPVAGEFRLMLAYERNGAPLDRSKMDVTGGRISGEGPLRLVVPQEKPGKPDRGSRFSPSDCCDGFDYREDADHNAGAMVRGVVAIRIDPMPEGVEEYDSVNGGWAVLDAGHLIVYGHNVR
jgi:hypothetical protein